MGAQWVGRVLAASKAAGNAGMVLVALAWHANDADPEGTCWPAYERIAAYAHVGRRTVSRCLGELTALGELDIRRGRHVNTYRLRLPQSANSGPVTSPQSANSGPLNGSSECQIGYVRVPNQVGQSANSGPGTGKNRKEQEEETTTGPLRLTAPGPGVQSRGRRLGNGKTGGHEKTAWPGDDHPSVALTPQRVAWLTAKFDLSEEQVRDAYAGWKWWVDEHPGRAKFRDWTKALRNGVQFYAQHYRRAIPR